VDKWSVICENWHKSWELFTSEIQSIHYVWVHSEQYATPYQYMRKLKYVQREIRAINTVYKMWVRI
jgi:hypothetical protein